MSAPIYLHGALAVRFRVSVKHDLLGKLFVRELFLGGNIAYKNVCLAVFHLVTRLCERLISRRNADDDSAVAVSGYHRERHNCPAKLPFGT